MSYALIGSTGRKCLDKIYLNILLSTVKKKCRFLAFGKQILAIFKVEFKNLRDGRRMTFK